METPSRAPVEPPLYQAELRPHMSATRRNINTVVILFALISLPVGVVFAVLGAWPVSLFVGFDVILLFLMLRFHQWGAGRREVITLSRSAITVERISASGRKRVWRAAPYWLKVHLTKIDDDRNQLELTCREASTVIGQFLTADEKSALADELRERLHRLSVWKGVPA